MKVVQPFEPWDRWGWGKGLLDMTTDTLYVWGGSRPHHHEAYGQLSHRMTDDHTMIKDLIIEDKLYIYPDREGDQGLRKRIKDALGLIGQPHWEFDAKLALDYDETWPQGTELYHVAPLEAKDSIAQYGLIGAEHPSHSPWPYAKEEWYDKGNYLFTSFEGAEEYAINVAQMTESEYVIVTIDGSGLTTWADPENAGAYEDFYQGAGEGFDDMSYWDWRDVSEINELEHPEEPWPPGFRAFRGAWSSIFTPDPIGPERIINISQPYSAE